MANIMSQIKLKNHTSRDGFDLSRRNAFTAKVSELLPVACIECLPGDYIEARTQHFTRTMPVSTAAYTRMREYYDWFFVPTNLLWNKFNSFVTQMVDNNQHAVGITTRQVLSDTHPYFTTNQVHQYIRSLYGTATPDTNYFGFERGQLTAKLMNYLGYGDFSPSLAEGASTNDFPYKENVNLNPFPLLAYQKIYQDYYRHSQWEQAYAPAFNIDYISGAEASLNMPISTLFNDYAHETMFDLRYSNWNKDLFMGLLPNSQYGESASVILDPEESFNNRLLLTNFTKGNSLTTGTSGRLQVNTNLLTDEGNKIYNVTTSNSEQVNLYITSSQIVALRDALGINNFGILALRQAEALQKWREITQSQHQDYKSQVEAHFGVSPSNALSERCQWIDGHVSNLDISEVTNTNITGTNPADIAGKGVGVGDGKMKFKTDVHGYLLCIYHCVPILDYSITGINRMNLKTKVTDYAIPEFDKSGMVSVPLIELTNSLNTSDKLNNDLLGYAPRYYDYKQALDEVHGAFKSELAPWVAPFDDSYIQNYLTNYLSLKSLNYIFFKVNPAIMNPVFGYNVDSTVDSDQLLVNTAFDISAVRNLDRNGLPY